MANTDNSAARPSNKLLLTKCIVGGSKDHIKDIQMRYFCYMDNLCKDDVDPNIFYVERWCKGDSEYRIFMQRRHADLQHKKWQQHIG